MATGGIIGGSQVFQALWGTYSGVATTVTGQLVNDVLPIAATFVLGGIQLVTIIAGANLMYGRLDQGEAVKRIVTCIIVSALMTPALFNQFVVQTLTQDIPNQISSAVGGAAGLQGAQGFDALLNQITQFAATAGAQMIGITYIGDRVVLGIAEIFAKGFLAICFAIWAIAALSVDFIVPLLAILAPTFLFNATRAWGERAIGRVVGLLLVQMIALMVGSVIVKAEGQFMQQFATTVASPPPDQGFSMNGGGDVAFTGFSEVGAVGGPGTTPQAAGANTINTEAAIESMIGMVLSLLFGVFLLGQVTRTAYGIAASSGFSAAPVVNSITNAVTRIVAASARGAGRAVAR